MKRIRKACLCIIMSSVLLSSCIISKALYVDQSLSLDEMKPADLYDVNFEQALNENLKDADIVVLGDYQFRDQRVFSRTATISQSTSSVAISTNTSEKIVLENSFDDDKIKMMVVSNGEIKTQTVGNWADTIRYASDNGYVVFFDTADYEDIHRITKDVYEEYGLIYGVKTVNEDTNDIIYEGTNPYLAYFYVTKSKDNCFEFHFVFSNAKNDALAVEQSMLEHAYANRNMGKYVLNEDEYLASQKAKKVQYGDMTSASAKGFHNPVRNGVQFYGDWKCSPYNTVYTYEYYHENNHPNITHRITITTSELMSHDLVGGRRLWAQVSKIDLKVNNTSSTDRPFANRNVWWWSEESSNYASLKTYAPTNAPKSTTYTYGINGEISGGVSGGTDGVGASAGISIGASFTKTIEVSDVEYYTNAYDLDYNISGTTFNAIFTRGCQYAQNHSEHTTVTFFSKDTSYNSFTFYNKLKHQSSCMAFGTWGPWADSNPVEWPYTDIYHISTSASDYYFK